MDKINFTKVFVWLFSIAVIILLIWALLPKAISVSVSEIKRGPYQQMIEEDGKTRAKDIYVVSSPASGHMSRIQLKEGDLVSKNQTLATIIPNQSTLYDMRTILVLEKLLSSQKSSLRKAQALVARAKSALITAKSDLDRRLPLLKKGFIAHSVLDQFKLNYQLKKREYEAALAELNEAQHMVELVKAAMKHSTLSEHTQKSKQYMLYLRSPENARILRIMQKSGGAVNVGQAIMELADPRKLEVVGDMLSTDAVKIPQNAKVLIKRWGGEQPLVGHVRLIEPRGFTKTSALGIEEQRVNVIIDFTSPKDQWEKLGTGYRVDVEVILFEAKNVLKVPVSALFRDKKQWAVFVIQNGKAKKQDIVVKWRNPVYAVVTKGLQQGDKVINYPSDQIKTGQKVKSTTKY